MSRKSQVGVGVVDFYLIAPLTKALMQTDDLILIMYHFIFSHICQDYFSCSTEPL